MDALPYHIFANIAANLSHSQSWKLRLISRQFRDWLQSREFWAAWIACHGPSAYVQKFNDYYDCIRDGEPDPAFVAAYLTNNRDRYVVIKLNFGKCEEFENRYVPGLHVVEDMTVDADFITVGKIRCFLNALGEFETISYISDNIVHEYISNISDIGYVNNAHLRLYVVPTISFSHMYFILGFEPEEKVMRHTSGNKPTTIWTSTEIICKPE